MKSVQKSGPGSCSYLARIASGEQVRVGKIKNKIVRRHAHEAARAFLRGKPWPSLVEQNISRVLAAVELRSDLLKDSCVRSGSIIAVAIRIAAYADRWLREPEAWTAKPDSAGTDQLAGLLNHLFARYPMRSGLNNVWYLPGAICCSERDWYIHVATGGSPRSKGVFPTTMTRRAFRNLIEEPDRVDFREAI
jgi:hypothetical protein